MLVEENREMVRQNNQLQGKGLNIFRGWERAEGNYKEVGGGD